MSEYYHSSPEGFKAFMALREEQQVRYISGDRELATFISGLGAIVALKNAPAL